MSTANSTVSRWPPVRACHSDVVVLSRLPPLPQIDVAFSEFLGRVFLRRHCVGINPTCTAMTVAFPAVLLTLLPVTPSLGSGKLGSCGHFLREINMHFVDYTLLSFIFLPAP